MSVAYRASLPVRQRWVFGAACAAALLALAPKPAGAQMQPWLPYRLTHNGPDEFTYATSARINRVGYEVYNHADAGGGSFANAFVLLDGSQTHRLSDISSPGQFAGYVGQLADQFVVSRKLVTGPSPTAANTAINLLLHDGHTALPITHNPPGMAAAGYLPFGQLVFTNHEYDQQSRPIRTDIHHWLGSATVNLTNNPLGATSSPHAVGAGELFIFTTYDDSSTRRDLSFSPLDGSPTLRLTEGGQVSFGIQQVPGGHLYRLAPDVFFFDGHIATNLTNNPPGFSSSFTGLAGGDLIFRRGAPGGEQDLLRYRDGAFINMTNNPPGVSSQSAGTIGADVIVRTALNGSDPEQTVSNYSINDAATNANVALTHNSTGMHANLERFGDQIFIHIRDHRGGGPVTHGLFLHHGNGSVALANYPPQVHLRFPPVQLGDDFAWTAEDLRAGVGNHQRLGDIYLFRDGVVRNLSNNAPGAQSRQARVVGGDIVFHTAVNATGDPSAAWSDVMLFDGQSTRNLTNLSLHFAADFKAPLGDDLIISINDASAGTQSHQQRTNLFRYARSGQRWALSDNGVGEYSRLMEVRDERAVWYDAEVVGSRITGIFSGDGFGPPTLLYLPPADQTLRGGPSYGDLVLFKLEGGEGDARFSNILVWLDEQMVPLTDNGPGWLANIRLPGFIPNYYGKDDALPELAIIELLTTSGDRRDVTVVMIPEPAAAAPMMLAALIARARRRAAVRV